MPTYCGHATKRHVTLTDDERAQLHALLTKGTHHARVLTRARILLAADQSDTDANIAATLHVSPATVANVRTRYAAGGLDRALYDAPRPGGTRKLDGAQEATLVALACTTPPEGHTVWTMQLLADRLVTLGVVDTLSDETVRRTLKKTPSNRGRSSTGASHT